jgi:hypothetical protein
MVSPENVSCRYNFCKKHLPSENPVPEHKLTVSQDRYKCSIHLIRCLLLMEFLYDYRGDHFRQPGRQERIQIYLIDQLVPDTQLPVLRAAREYISCLYKLIDPVKGKQPEATSYINTPVSEYEKGIEEHFGYD